MKQHISMPKKKNKLKFPKDWKVYRLGDLGDFLKGKGISKKDRKESGIPCILYGEIYTKHHFYVKEFVSFIDNKTASKSMRLEKGDILFTGSGETREEIGKPVAYLDDREAYAGGDIIILRPKNINSLFLSYLLNLEHQIKERARLAEGHSVVHIYPNELKSIRVHIPTLLEQKKIAAILSTWDKAIELKEKLIEQKKEQKKGLMQKLITGKIRLPGFDGKWSKKSFEDIFTKISVKKHQIKTTEYIEFGEYPVVDQGQKKIIAYSNDKDKVLKVPDTGLIVFGDHTREIKFIDFDFVVGADGTQVLNTKEGYDLKFYYYHLLIQKIPNNGYSRHFKFLKEMIFFKPSLKEQKAISNLLSTFDNELDLLNSELKLLKQQKKGLMQLLLTGKVRVKV